MIHGLHHRLVGHFSHSDQVKPEYDPGMDAPCIVCMEPIERLDMVTVSVALRHDRKSSLFYRAHRECQRESGAQIESAIIDREVGQ